MDRQLIRLDDQQLDEIISISVGGFAATDTSALARTMSKALGVVGVRVAVSSADYLQTEDGTPEPDTRTASGIWWHSKGDDTALIGGFIIEGHAMTITTEGEGECPVAESIDVIDRATRAIACQYEGAEIVEMGLFKFMAPAGERPVRVVVTRDHRVRRPQDLLDPDELETFVADALGFVIVQLIGGGKALVVAHGI